MLEVIRDRDSGVREEDDVRIDSKMRVDWEYLRMADAARGSAWDES
jgi:hypothetical protein